MGASAEAGTGDAGAEPRAPRTSGGLSPQFEHLRSNPKTAKLLNNPAMAGLLNDPDVLKALEVRGPKLLYNAALLRDSP